MCGRAALPLPRRCRDHDGFVTADDFLRIMKKKSENPLDDLSDDDDDDF